jgi:hypothetical protein
MTLTRLKELMERTEKQVKLQRLTVLYCHLPRTGARQGLRIKMVSRRRLSLECMMERQWR